MLAGSLLVRNSILTNVRHFGFLPFLRSVVSRVAINDFVILAVFDQVGEMKKACSIRYLSGEEVKVHEASCCIAVMYCIFDSCIRKAESIRQ